MNNVCNFEIIASTNFLFSKIIRTGGKGISAVATERQPPKLSSSMVVINKRYYYRQRPIQTHHTQHRFLFHTISHRKKKLLFGELKTSFCVLILCFVFLKTRKKKEFLYSACFVRSKIPQRPQLLIRSLSLFRSFTHSLSCSLCEGEL